MNDIERAIERAIEKIFNKSDDEFNRIHEEALNDIWGYYGQD